MSKKKRRQVRASGRDLHRSSGPTLLKAGPVPKLHWVLQVCVQRNLDHLRGWRLHSPSGPCSSFWPPSLVNMFSLYLVMFLVLQLCLLPLITQHLSLNIFRKLLGAPKATSTPSWPSPAPPASLYRASAPFPPSWGPPLNSLQLINVFPALQTWNWAQTWPQKCQK